MTGAAQTEAIERYPALQPDDERVRATRSEIREMLRGAFVSGTEWKAYQMADRLGELEDREAQFGYLLRELEHFRDHRLDESMTINGVWGWLNFLIQKCAMQARRNDVETVRPPLSTRRDAGG